MTSVRTVKIVAWFTVFLMVYNMYRGNTSLWVINLATIAALIWVLNRRK